MNPTRITFIFFLCASSLLGQNRFGLINVSVDNLRKTPIYTSELVSQALMGTPVQCLEVSGDWTQITTPDQMTAWVKTNTLSLLSDTTYLQWKHSRRVLAIQESGSIYSEPQEGATPVSNFVAGAILVQLEQRLVNNYIRVMLPDSTQGYMSLSSVCDFEQQRTGDIRFDPLRALHQAFQWMGRPYLWGGMSPFGMDCSGFIRTIFQDQGIILPRNASEQATCGRAIPKDSVQLFQVGDLMFFRSHPNRGSKITHVAMYIGDGKIIQSASRVKVNSFNKQDSCYDCDLQGRLISVKRISGGEKDSGVSTYKTNPFY